VEEEQIMKIEPADLDRALKVLEGLVKDRNLRCGACGTLLAPKSKPPWPVGPGLSDRSRPDTLYLECPGCHKRYALPADVREEAARRMVAHKCQADPPTSDTCPECGSGMVPEGRCFVCYACGYSRCG
jgi:hypothetical protein